MAAGGDLRTSSLFHIRCEDGDEVGTSDQSSSTSKICYVMVCTDGNTHMYVFCCVTHFIIGPGSCGVDLDDELGVRGPPVGYLHG